MNIDAIIESNNLVDIVERAGGKPQKTFGNEYRCACPLHNGDNETGFVIYEDGRKQKWKCFTRECGFGDVIDFVMIWKNCDFKSAIECLGGDLSLTTEEAAQLTVERERRAKEHKQKKWEEYLEAVEALRKAQKWRDYYQNLLNSQEAQCIWEARGIPYSYQTIWELGYCQDFHYYSSNGKHLSPSITIPIFGADDKKLLNIRHRILNPFNPKDKYRPERPGLRAVPFLTDPELGYDNANMILVVEGEIKAMVTWICLDMTDTQVIGIPGKQSFRKLIDKLNGKNVVLMFDPDAEKEVVSAANSINGRYIELIDKIDDLINDDLINTASLRRLLRQARKPYEH